MHVSRRSSSEAETRVIGMAIGKLLRGGDVVLLDGALGAGKTTLVRAVATGMGLDTRPVASPTFVLIHEYAPEATAAGPALIHVDAYRLRGPDDLDSLGWDRVMADVGAGRAAAMIEWSERLGEAAPAGAGITIEHIDETSREFLMDIPDGWADRPAFADLAARSPTTCPITGRPVPADSPTYPFADERARLADLYRWFSGSYSVSRDISEANIDEDAPPGPAGPR